MEATCVKIWNSHLLYIGVAQNTQTEFTDLTTNGRIHFLQDVTNSYVLCLSKDPFTIYLTGFVFTTGLQLKQSKWVPQNQFLRNTETNSSWPHGEFTNLTIIWTEFLVYGKLIENSVFKCVQLQKTIPIWPQFLWELNQSKRLCPLQQR